MATDKITVEGFVSKDPEQLEAGQHRITSVTVPVEQGRMKDGQWVADTDQQGQKIVRWWEAEFWNEQGDAIGQTIRKGQLVTITGEPRPRAFVRNDGTAGLSFAIANPSIGVMVRRPARGGGSGGGSGAPATQQPQQSWGAPQGDPGTFGGGFEDSQPF